MSEGKYATAVAVADLLDHDVELLDLVEGLLLVAAGTGESITPVKVAHETPLKRDTVANLFRQLDSVDSVRRESYNSSVAESEYRVRSAEIRRLFSTTRQAINLIEAYQNRQPPATEASPLVTFPEDPAFADVTPTEFGMEQLLSALATEAKNSSDEIVLLAPFFEGVGFKRLQEVLADALERGVDLTIITRYLADTESHNRAVISDFLAYLQAERGVADRVKTVDYTVWEEGVPANERRQDGAKPAFTLHAKVMLFDNRAAYVGSANVTNYGFDRYLELGVLLRGPPVNRYRELYDYLMESDAATEISI